MAKKNSAPKGKGKVDKKRFKGVKLQKPQKTKEPQHLLSIDAVMKFMKDQGLQVTPGTEEQLKELAQIKPFYEGQKTDAFRHLKRFMLQALERSLGVVAHAARLTGIHRSTHYAWIETDEEYRNAVQSLSEVALDFSEEKLFELVREKNPAAVFFHLKTKGKKRGYVETVHNVNQTFDDNNVHIYIPDNGRDNYEEAKTLTE